MGFNEQGVSHNFPLAYLWIKIAWHHNVCIFHKGYEKCRD